MPIATFVKNATIGLVFCSVGLQATLKYNLVVQMLMTSRIAPLSVAAVICRLYVERSMIMREQYVAKARCLYSSFRGFLKLIMPLRVIYLEIYQLIVQTQTHHSLYARQVSYLYQQFRVQPPIYIHFTFIVTQVMYYILVQ